MVVLLIRYHERILQAGLHLKHVVTGDHKKNIQEVCEIYERVIGIILIHMLNARIWEEDNLVISTKIACESSYMSKLERRVAFDAIRPVEGGSFTSTSGGGGPAYIMYIKKFKTSEEASLYVKTTIKELISLGIPVQIA